MFKRFLSKNKKTKQQHVPVIGNPYNIDYHPDNVNSKLLAKAAGKYTGPTVSRGASSSSSSLYSHREEKDNEDDNDYNEYLKGIQESIKKHEKVNARDWAVAFGSIKKKSNKRKSKRSRKTNKRKNKNKNKRH